jgi:Helix-turn-helix domain
MKKKRNSPKKNLKDDTINMEERATIPNCIMKDPAISVGAKMTYGMLLHYACANDFCFPGQARLAQDIGFTRVQVTRAITELTSVGLVAIQRRGNGQTNLYKIHRPKPSWVSQKSSQPNNYS